MPWPPTLQVPFKLEPMLAHLERIIETRGHAVVCLAEGAGQVGSAAVWLAGAAAGVAAVATQAEGSDWYFCGALPGHQPHRWLPLL